MKTVLILDDEDPVRESLMDFFEDRGWRVLAAASAEAALELLQRERVDGAVVDIRLPGMDGNAFIDTAGKAYPQLVFVICTGSPDYQPSNQVSLLSTVSDKVFLKPVADLYLLADELSELIKDNRSHTRQGVDNE